MKPFIHVAAAQRWLDAINASYPVSVRVWRIRHSSEPRKFPAQITFDTMGWSHACNFRMLAQVEYGG